MRGMVLQLQGEAEAGQALGADAALCPEPKHAGPGNRDHVLGSVVVIYIKVKGLI